jgi:alanyl-tRNA synthetase
MTERLYYADAYLTQFDARPLEIAAGGRLVYLDRTAFYPASGGQPFDTGTLNGIAVLEVSDEEDRIAHRLAAPLTSSNVQGVVDWPRRFDHMQQHTGQHLLSAVLAELFGLRTVSFHLGAEASTIDIEAPGLSDDQLRAAERRANEVVWANRPVSAALELAGEVEGLRKPTGRQGEIRVVTIAALDRSACGGTHVRASGEIGAVLLRKLEKIRGNVRIEFLCGRRAIARARADFDALARVARVFSSQLDDTPALVATQAGELRESERLRRKLSLERASQEGRELWAAAPPAQNGLRQCCRKLAAGAVDDEMRALAQGFTSQGSALFAAAFQAPPGLLLAVSSDSGVHAGNRLKEVLGATGGRGGGNAALAQGSLPSAAALSGALALLGLE